MKELKDYSGPYVPGLKYEDLSKDVLVKLLRAFSRECNVLPAYWAEEVRKRLGRDVERECMSVHLEENRQVRDRVGHGSCQHQGE